METDPAIPYGYRRITGLSQRGDGIWDGTRFRKVKKEYPHSEGRPGFNFIIRKCEVVQTELPRTEGPAVTPQDVANLFSADAKRLCEQAQAAMDKGVDKMLTAMVAEMPVLDLDE